MSTPEECSAVGQTAVEQWLHGRSPHTADAYRRDLRQFFHTCGKDEPARVTLADVQAFDVALASRETRSGKPLAAATRARKLAAVKSFLRFCQEQGHTQRNAAAAVKLPRSRDGLAERILTEGELARVIAAAGEGAHGERNGFILRLLYRAALRVSEAVALRWRDVVETAPDRGLLVVFGKGGKTGSVAVAGSLWSELEGRRGAPPERVVPLSRQRVWQIVRAASEGAGLEKAVSPHWMRHAHVSHALDRGAPVHLVRETARHASLATTSRYAHAKKTESSGSYLAL